MVNERDKIIKHLDEINAEIDLILQESPNYRKVIIPDFVSFKEQTLEQKIKYKKFQSLKSKQLELLDYLDILNIMGISNDSEIK